MTVKQVLTLTLIFDMLMAAATAAGICRGAHGSDVQQDVRYERHRAGEVRPADTMMLQKLEPRRVPWPVVHGVAVN